MRARAVLIIFGLILSGGLIRAAGIQNKTWTPEAVRAYLNASSRDPIAQLQNKLDSGKSTLRFNGERGYLDSLLKVLNIPISSQTLVFSKTSVQKKLITPKTPRAIYFNDYAYVGWTPGSKEIEISTTDANLGAVFYILPQRQGMRPMFVRHGQECLQCHVSTLTLNVPGHLMRSVACQDDGGVIPNEASFLTSDRSPFGERWGGWYVSGDCGGQKHQGNRYVDDDGRPAELDVRTLEAAHYPNPQSDVAALMILGHQTSVQTLMVRVAQTLNAKSPASQIAAICEPLVRALLFADEMPLTEPVRGSSRFTQEFARRGPFDSNGRSLRQLDLNRRLLRYPCSYLIYSPQFDGLVRPARDYVCRRILAILDGNAGAGFKHLSAHDRLAILQILRQTKPEFRKLRPWAQGLIRHASQESRRFGRNTVTCK